MAESRAVNPLVEQFQKGDVPRELRLLGAQGALPLKPADLVELLHSLARDPDAQVRAAAVGSLTSMPVADMLPILKDKSTPGAVLAWALGGRTERELLEVVLQNTSLPDEAIESHAAELPAELAELVVINQVRLLRRTSLLVALEGNVTLSNDQRRRLRELRETFKIGEEPEPAPPPPPAAPPPSEPVVEPAAQAYEVLSPSDMGEEPAGEILSEQDAIVRYLTEEERAESEKVNAVQKIYRMNTAEKIIAALKGSREERTVLIRDPNRLVATAVLGSPRLTEAEVEAIAGMKNISGEILRKVGTHRDWTKKYTVVSTLVKNPRTPIAIAIGMVSRLNPRDLKALSVDRNVSDVIRKQAQKFVKNQLEKK